MRAFRVLGLLGFRVFRALGLSESISGGFRVYRALALRGFGFVFGLEGGGLDV